MVVVTVVDVVVVRSKDVVVVRSNDVVVVSGQSGPFQYTVEVYVW